MITNSAKKKIVETMEQYNELVRIYNENLAEFNEWIAKVDKRLHIIESQVNKPKQTEKKITKD